MVLPFSKAKVPLVEQDECQKSPTESACTTSPTPRFYSLSPTKRRSPGRSTSTSTESTTTTNAPSSATSATSPTSASSCISPEPPPATAAVLELTELKFSPRRASLETVTPIVTARRPTRALAAASLDCPVYLCATEPTDATVPRDHPVSPTTRRRGLTAATVRHQHDSATRQPYQYHSSPVTTTVTTTVIASSPVSPTRSPSPQKLLRPPPSSPLHPLRRGSGLASAASTATCGPVLEDDSMRPVVTATGTATPPLASSPVRHSRRTRRASLDSMVVNHSPDTVRRSVTPSTTAATATHRIRRQRFHRSSSVGQLPPCDLDAVPLDATVAAWDVTPTESLPRLRRSRFSRSSSVASQLGCRTLAETETSRAPRSRCGLGPKSPSRRQCVRTLVRPSNPRAVSVRQLDAPTNDTVDTVPLEWSPKPDASLVQSPTRHKQRLRRHRLRSTGNGAAAVAPSPWEPLDACPNP